MKVAEYADTNRAALAPTQCCVGTTAPTDDMSHTERPNPLAKACSITLLLELVIVILVFVLKVLPEAISH